MHKQTHRHIHCVSCFSFFLSFSCVREMMPPKLEVNTQCMVLLYAFRYVTMCARLTGPIDEDEIPTTTKKRGKKVAYKRNKLAGGSKASRFYDLHPPSFLMTKKGLVQLLSMYKHTLTHIHRERESETNEQAKQQTLSSTKTNPYRIYTADSYVHTHTRERAHNDTIRKMFQPSVWI